MDLDEIKRGLRAEIKKRENEQYFTFQCNVRQMCKDVLAKLEEQESVIADKDKELRHQKYKRCLAMAMWCKSEAYIHEYGSEYDENLVAWFGKWYERWLGLAEKFKDKEAK